MIEGISPDRSAITDINSNVPPPEQRLTDPLSFLIAAALYGGQRGGLDLMRDVLPYVSARDRCAIEDMLDCAELSQEVKVKRRNREPIKRSCLSPQGNLSGLICVLERYATPQGRMFLCRLRSALDTARIIGALSDNPDPAELLRFMGMGDAAELMGRLPQIMSMFGTK